MRAIDAGSDFRPLHERRHGQERKNHQSFTPAGAARRVRPVRSRRVRNSSCPIERSTCSACDSLIPLPLLGRGGGCCAAPPPPPPPPAAPPCDGVRGGLGWD